MSGYTLEQFGGMLADPLRRDAFYQSMRRAIGPETVVLDLGAGPGILSLLACQLGAKRVHAIEPNPALRLLPACAKRNGYADRISCYQADSRQVELPEQVDLIVADLRGALPILGSGYEAVTDACKRFLKPGGKLLPGGDRVYLAPVSEPLERARQAQLWRAEDWGIDLSVLADFRRGVTRQSTARAEDLLSAEQCWAKIRYLPDPVIDSAKALSFEVSAAGQLDGFLCWYDLDFDDQISLSNHPAKPRLVYGRSIFSLSQSSKVEPGDHIELQLQLIPGDYNQWIWRGTVHSADGELRLRFNESSLKAQLLDLQRG